MDYTTVAVETETTARRYTFNGAEWIEIGRRLLPAGVRTALDVLASGGEAPDVMWIDRRGFGQPITDEQWGEIQGRLGNHLEDLLAEACEGRLEISEPFPDEPQGARPEEA